MAQLFSKNALIKLNRELRDSESPSAEALCKLQQYRLSYKEIIKEVFDIVTEEATKINSEAICAFRIKRIDSIIRKLKRLKGGIELKSMGDIAGCRCILTSDAEVYKLMKAIKKHPRIKTCEINNYIAHPKPSGYKSIHMYVTIDGYDKMRIEIQLRSRQHHDWATFVEVLDLIYKVNVKEQLHTRTSKYKELAQFHHILSKPDNYLQKEDIHQLFETIIRYDIMKRVSSHMLKNIVKVRKQWATLMTEHPERPNYFYICTSENREPLIKAFSSYKESEDYYYSQFEQDSKINQVLVCLNEASFDTISIAYSNYMLACHEFSHRIPRFLAIAINKQWHDSHLLDAVNYYKKRLYSMLKFIDVEGTEIAKAEYDDDIMNEWKSDVQEHFERFKADSKMLSKATYRMLIRSYKGFDRIRALSNYWRFAY